MKRADKFLPHSKFYKANITNVFITTIMFTNVSDYNNNANNIYV